MVRSVKAKKRYRHLAIGAARDRPLLIKFIAAFLAGVAFTALVMSVFSANQHHEHAYRAAKSETPTAPVYSKQAMRVASWFICPCFEKCTDGLDQCICSHPGGAIEMKNLIQAQLDAGMPEGEIIRLFQKKYGGLRPELKAKLEALK